MAVGRHGLINPEYDIIEIYARFYENAQYGHDSGERPIKHDAFLEFLRNFERLIRLVNAKADEAREKEWEREERERERLSAAASAKKLSRSPKRQLTWDAEDLD